MISSIPWNCNSVVLAAVIQGVAFTLPNLASAPSSYPQLRPQRASHAAQLPEGLQLLQCLAAAAGTRAPWIAVAAPALHRGGPAHSADWQVPVQG